MEPNVYILFCLCPHPMQRFEESEKNQLLYLSLSPALLLDGGWGGVRMREGRERQPGPGSLLKQSAALASRYLLALGTSLKSLIRHWLSSYSSFAWDVLSPLSLAAWSSLGTTCSTQICFPKCSCNSWKLEWALMVARKPLSSGHEMGSWPAAWHSSRY